jgi:hypothetical protein
MCCKDIYISLNWDVIFSMATGEATGNVQRNRIAKSEQSKAGLKFSGASDSPSEHKKGQQKWNR